MANVREFEQDSNSDFKLGVHAFQSGDFKRAIGYFTDVINRTDKSEVYTLLARAYSALGSHKAAADVYMRLISRGRPPFEVLLALAMELDAGGYRVNPFDFVLNSLASFDRIVHVRQGYMKYIWDNALVKSLFEKLSYTEFKGEKVDLKTRRNLRLIPKMLKLMDRENFPETITAAESADPEGESFVYTREIAANAAYAAGDYELAEKIALKTLDDFPESSGALSIIAAMSVNGYITFDASSKVEEIINLHKENDNKDALLALITSFYFGGCFEFSRKAADAAYEIAPYNEYVIFYAALSKLSAGKRAEAKKIAERAVKLYPQEIKFKALLYKAEQSEPDFSVFFRHGMGMDLTMLLLETDSMISSGINILDVPTITDMTDLILWDGRSPDLAARVTVLVNADRELFEPHFVMRLRDPEFPIQSVLSMIEGLLRADSTNVKAIVYLGDKVAEVNIAALDKTKLSRNPKNIFCEAYIKAYIALLKTGHTPIVRILRTVVREMSHTQTGLSLINATAAVVYYKYLEYQGIEIAPEKVAARFETRLHVFSKYLAVYNTIIR